MDRGFALELDELLKASAYVLGKSRVGIVYKVVLGSRVPVAVRRLGEGGAQRRSEFAAEAQAVGRVRHPNVVRLRAFYWSPEGKLLVSDFVANGSLAAALHGGPRRIHRQRLLLCGPHPVLRRRPPRGLPRRRRRLLVGKHRLLSKPLGHPSFAGIRLPSDPFRGVLNMGTTLLPLNRVSSLAADVLLSSGVDAIGHRALMGCQAVMVGHDGDEQQRFVAPVAYLSHPLFMQLLKEAEDEYGFNHSGAIALPCHVEEFRCLQTLIDRERFLPTTTAVAAAATTTTITATTSISTTSATFPT